MTAKPNPKHQLRVTEDGPDREFISADISLRPSVNGGVTQISFSSTIGELDLTSVVAALDKQTDLVANGSLERLEAMLTVQAHTLDIIFNDFARRAAWNAGDYQHAADLYMRLALKAQAQCRSTIEAIAEIKNPRSVAFVKQANIANGAQQVNNGVCPDASRAGESVKAQSKLLESNDVERLDLGAKSEPISTYSQLEAVGALDRP